MQLWFISTPVGGTLDVLERQELYLYREIARLILVEGALIFAKAAATRPYNAIIVFSIAGFTGYLLHVFVSWWPCGVTDCDLMLPVPRDEHDDEKGVFGCFDGSRSGRKRVDARDKASKTP